MLFSSLDWPGPTVWWHPTAGQRHAFGPDLRPTAGQHRRSLCDQQVTLTPADRIDWLLPTCDACMTRARDRAQARERRRP